MFDQFKNTLDTFSDEQLKEILNIVRSKVPHPFEKRIGVEAEVILSALDRSADITIRGIRGIIAEAIFIKSIAPYIEGWKVVEEDANDQTWDAKLQKKPTETIINGKTVCGQIVKIQIKLQRKEAGVPKIKDGKAIVEVQKTRTGKKHGIDTRPYSFSDFDVLAVCMEPSTQNWRNFKYVPSKFLKQRKKNPELIEVMQPVPFEDDEHWKSSFLDCMEVFYR